MFEEVEETKEGEDLLGRILRFWRIFSFFVILRKFYYIYYIRRGKIYWEEFSDFGEYFLFLLYLESFIPVFR